MNVLASASRHPFREPLKHERLPDPGIYVGGKPVYVLPSGTERERGDAALVQHIEIIEGVMGLVKSCLGPNSRYKLIKAESGADFLTKDAFTIFTKVQLTHPLAQVVVGAGVDAARVTGGGSTTTVIIAAQILKNLLSLVRSGVKQSVLVSGCLRALERIRKESEHLSILEKDPLGAVRSVVRTALAGSLLAPYTEVFENLVLDAVRYTRALETKEFWRLEDIYMRAQVGGALSDSRLVRGLALLREGIHPATLEHRKKGGLLLVKGEFNLPRKGKTPHYEHQFNLSSPEEYARMLRSKQGILIDVMSRVLESGADVILVEKGVDDVALDYLVRRNVIVIRRFPPQEFEHVMAVTGARPVADFSDASPSDVVTVKLVDFVRIAGNTWWFLEGFADARSCEVFFRGPDDLTLKEGERLLKGVFKLLAGFLKDPRYLFGGGWYEVMLAKELRNYSRMIHDRGQIVVERVAEALEYIPYLLAETSGLDALATVAELRRLNAVDGQKFGVDGHSRRVEDVRRLKIVEPLHVKLQSVVSAFEAAVTVLRVDQVIRSRKLSNAEKYYLERLEKTTPEATRKIYRDYGI